jgi:hypothetical protein
MAQAQGDVAVLQEVFSPSISRNIDVAGSAGDWGAIFRIGFLLHVTGNKTQDSRLKG